MLLYVSFCLLLVSDLLLQLLSFPKMQSKEVDIFYVFAKHHKKPFFFQLDKKNVVCKKQDFDAAPGTAANIIRHVTCLLMQLHTFRLLRFSEALLVLYGGTKKPQFCKLWLNGPKKMPFIVVWYNLADICISEICSSPHARRPKVAHCAPAQPGTMGNKIFYPYFRYKTFILE